MEPLVSLQFPSADMLDRYLSGRATPDESVIVRVYLSRHPEAEQVLKQLPVLHLDVAGQSVPDVADWWETFTTRIGQESTHQQAGLPVLGNTPPTMANRQSAWRFLSARSAAQTTRWMAAGLAMMTLMVAGISFLVSNHGPNTSGMASGTPVVQTIVTQAGQRKTYRFPDGSSVMMAPGTTLQYTAGADHPTRDVVINGEALFTIAPDNNVPFVVRTVNAHVRVLGTTFTVRRYATDTTTQVVVAQGKVAVASRVLMSGDAAIVEADGQVRVEQRVDIGTVLQWTNGQLVFRRTSLRDVIQELERWYGLKITVVNPELLDRSITATFLIDAPERAIDGLSLLLNARATRDQNHVIFTARTSLRGVE